MSKKNRKRQPSKASRPLLESSNINIHDGIFNTVAGLSTSKDRTAHTKFKPDPPKSQQEIEDAYSFSGVMENFVCKPIEDMISKGIKGVKFFKLSQEEITALDNYLTKVLDFWKKLEVAMVCMSLGYGSGIWMDTRAKQTQRPLRPHENTRIKRLVVFDHEVLQADTYNCYEEPEHWIVGDPIVNGHRLHKSRLLIFPGRTVTPKRRHQNNGWGGREVDKIWSAWLAWRTVFSTPPHIALTYEQGIYKFKNLTKMMSNPEGKKVIKEKVVDLEAVRSFLHAHLIDTEDEYVRAGAPVSGLHEIMQMSERFMVAESGYPHTVVLGESPGASLSGNAAGQSQNENYYKKISNRQIKFLYSPYTQVFEMVAPALRMDTGLPFDDMSFEFLPIKDETKEEKTKREESEAKTDAVYRQLGDISREEMRDELGKRGTYNVSGKELPDPDPIELDDPEDDESEGE